VQKVIVVSGARSSTGKTNLAWQFNQLLGDAAVIKIGHNSNKPDLKNFFYPHGTSYQTIVENHAASKWLIIESNSIYDSVTPELGFFLDGDNPKPSAKYAKSKADIISGKSIDQQTMSDLSRKTGLDISVIEAMAWLAGARPKQTSAIILAGGKSSRMGVEKDSLEIHGTSMLNNLCELLRPQFDELMVCTGQRNLLLPEGVINVKDVVPEKGPLMGIYSGLESSSNQINFVMAVDIPDINFFTIRELLRWSAEYDIVLTSVKKRFTEPLFAVYNKSVAGKIKELLDKDKRKVSGLFELVKTKIVTIRDADWYYNINTPEDYKRYLEKTGN